MIVNQSIAITNEIYKLFDDGLEVRGVFLDTSNAFAKAWCERVLLKLNQNGISGNLLKHLLDFLFSSITTSSSELALMLRQS